MFESTYYLVLSGILYWYKPDYSILDGEAGHEQEMASQGRRLAQSGGSWGAQYSEIISYCVNVVCFILILWLVIVSYRMMMVSKETMNKPLVKERFGALYEDIRVDNQS